MSSAVLIMGHADLVVEHAEYPKLRDAQTPISGPRADRPHPTRMRDHEPGIDDGLVEVLIGLSRETSLLRERTKELELASELLQVSGRLVDRAAAPGVSTNVDGLPSRETTIRPAASAALELPRTALGAGT